MRFTEDDIKSWHEDGFVIIPDFFTVGEIGPLLEDFDLLYGRRGQGDGLLLDKKQPGSFGASHAKQFTNIDTLPYNASAAINMISLHPALISLAQRLLDTEQVHLYQSHTWAKYTGEADYDQGFHCDFGNHTLTVPAEGNRQRTVDIIIYLTDVTDGHGALHYVTKPDVDAVLGEGAIWALQEAEQFELKKRERSAASAAGSVVVHGIDTFHRGTNLTVPDGHRFTMTVGYKAAGNDMIGFTTWQHAADRPWQLVFNHADPAQLACLGIPLPGDPFWTSRTLRLTQQRWPDWDMRAYFAAPANEITR